MNGWDSRYLWWGCRAWQSLPVERSSWLADRHSPRAGCWMHRGCCSQGAAAPAAGGQGQRAAGWPGNETVAETCWLLLGVCRIRARALQCGQFPWAGENVSRSTWKSGSVWAFHSLALGSFIIPLQEQLCIQSALPAHTGTVIVHGWNISAGVQPASLPGSQPWHHPHDHHLYIMSITGDWTNEEMVCNGGGTSLNCSELTV